jgi:hypothetical protein
MGAKRVGGWGIAVLYSLEYFIELYLLIWLEGLDIIVLIAYRLFRR